MDQITRDSLPFYETELMNSITYIEQLSSQLETLQSEAPQLVVRVQDGQLDSYQCLSDLDSSEVDASVIEDLERHNHQQLSEHEVVSQEQDRELLDLHHVLGKEEGFIE